MARVAYLMSHYPAVSHAFVLREVEHVRATGVDLDTLSIHRTPAEQLLAEADRRAAATTFSVLPASPRQLAAAHLEALLRSPRRYLATLVLALRTGAPGVRERLWHLFYFAEAMLLLRYCRRAGITHIHALFADSATDVAMLVTHYRRGRAIHGMPCTWSLAVHGSVEFYNVRQYALADKLAHACFAVAVSDFGRSQLMRFSADEQWPHIHVVRCAVDLEHYAPPPEERPAWSGHAEVLFVGRLLPGKGITLLLEAIGDLRRRGLDVRLTVAGDGPARGSLERAARHHGVSEAVRFLGAVGQDALLEVYRAADLFCLPSFAEGIPVVAMEAMATELPVVITRIMGVPELVDDGVEGLLIPPGRVDALTEALERLVRDPEQRRRMGRAGRQRIARQYEIGFWARRMRAVLEAELGVLPGGRR
jgi:colanic acid/amylovoran biosynthesis glycosyltransferase